jgi:hypothetical protein
MAAACDRHTNSLREATAKVVVLPMSVSLAEAAKMVPSQLGMRDLCTGCQVEFNQWMERKED